MLIKITVEQGGTVLSEAKIHLDNLKDLSTAIKSEVDKISWQDWQDRSDPLWGVIIKIDQPGAED